MGSKLSVKSKSAESVESLYSLCENCRIIEWCEDCGRNTFLCYACGGIRHLLCNECENPNWSLNGKEHTMLL